MPELTIRDAHETDRKSLDELTQYVRIAEFKRWKDAPALREELQRRVNDGRLQRGERVVVTPTALRLESRLRRYWLYVVRKANRNYECGACDRDIPAGVLHAATTAQSARKPGLQHLCLGCVERIEEDPDARP